MAWTDEPTEGQMGAWGNLTRWILPDDIQLVAVTWLKSRVNRKGMSEELSRVRDLYIGHKLDKVNCFDSYVWDGFEYKDEFKRQAEEALHKILKNS